MNTKRIRTSFLSRGFTIVELTIVIVVIGILAGISVVGYGKWRESVAQKEVQADLQTAASAMESAKNFGGGYPTDGNMPSTFKGSSNVSVSYYTGDSSSYCIDGVSNTNPSIHYFIDTTKGKEPLRGTCATGEEIPGSGVGGAIASGDPFQIVTNGNCPTDRTMVVDARDDHTYWVQKLADGKCWMLTNLAYAGGGMDTHSDVKTLSNGTSDTSTTYTEAKYYIPSGANPTTSPTQPSTSTDGTGQYGYLYNWCAAMGAQSGTSACANAATPAPDANTSICPSGWRLPTSNGGEFTALDNAINPGSGGDADAGLRSTWLEQRSGAWAGAFIYQGATAYYWSSSQIAAGAAYGLAYSATSGGPSSTSSKYVAFAVRCIAM